jgi:serine protease inhibitor
MRKIQIIIMLVVYLLSASQCTKSPNEPDNVRELTSLEKSIVDSDNRFGLKLFQEIVKTQKDTNIFISPLSVSMALGMTLNGADGATKQAMEQTLELVGLTEKQINESYKSLIDLLVGLDPKVIFQIANSIWYRQGVLVEQPFIDLNQNYFNALVSSLDFSNPQAVKTINDWVDENTNGKIKEILDRIDPAAVMFLINAIYFKGTWTYEFNKEYTLDDLFNRPDGSQVDCKMMQQSNDFMYAQTADFQIIDLPYGDGMFSMTVILPIPQKSIDELINQMDANQLKSWLELLKQQKGTLQLPHFKVEWELKLNEVLTKLGMGIAFNPFGADFSRITKQMALYIEFVKHKTFVQVDEEGTEAAAVTVVGLYESTGGGSSGFFMRVDRPFIFAIREHHSGTILFIGKIVEPS